ncbi:MAG: preprotein translocase subunit SecY [Acidobacteriota bacterium]
MLGGLQQAFKIGDLRSKVLFTLIMFAVFRLGCHIPVPGINLKAVEALASSSNFLSFFDVIAGGAFKRFSIFAMSITPYINASIIMQLLTVVIPSLEKMSKEGDEGRKKITQYTRYGTVVLGFIQAMGIAYAFSRSTSSAGRLMYEPGILSVLMVAVILTAGTALLMWIGEMITEKGIGNGISLIIFAGIVARIPSGISNIWQTVTKGDANPFSALLMLVLALAVIVFVIMLNEGQRRLPVQYAKRVVGRKVYGGQSTFLPIRVNMAGVIPIIFAMSITMFPATIASWLPKTNWFAQAINTYFSMGGWAYNILYAILIFGFTFFYTAIIFNPVDVADNIKKYGGFVPGIRPGRPTAEYIDKVLVRLTVAGGVALAFIAVLPSLFMAFTGFNIYFGGTALLIVVGVALDTMKQMEAHLLLRSYEGFVK